MLRAAPALLLPLWLAACGAGAPVARRPPPHPMRVMSINLCVDQLVLALLPPGRIASVSWLARDPDGSVMAAAARHVAINHGEAEEVIAAAPDLIVADTFGKPVLRAMLRRLGYPMIEIEQPTDLDAIRRATRQVAAAVDERSRGDRLIAEMDAGLADLQRRPMASLRVAAWGRDGIGARPGTLEDIVLTAAGARNIARETTRSGGIEALLAADPAALVEARSPAPDRGDAVLHHLLVERFWKGRMVPIDGAYTACGTPIIAAEAMRLRDRLRGVRSLNGPAAAMSNGPR